MRGLRADLLTESLRAVASSKRFCSSIGSAFVFPCSRHWRSRVGNFATFTAIRRASSRKKPSAPWPDVRRLRPIQQSRRAMSKPTALPFRPERCCNAEERIVRAVRTGLEIAARSDQSIRPPALAFSTLFDDRTTHIAGAELVLPIFQKLCAYALYRRTSVRFSPNSDLSLCYPIYKATTALQGASGEAFA